MLVLVYRKKKPTVLNNYYFCKVLCMIYRKEPENLRILFFLVWVLQHIWFITEFSEDCILEIFLNALLHKVKSRDTSFSRQILLGPFVLLNTQRRRILLRQCFESKRFYVELKQHFSLDTLLKKSEYLVSEPLKCFRGALYICSNVCVEEVVWEKLDVCWNMWCLFSAGAPLPASMFWD